jgi:hypothetical protein
MTRTISTSELEAALLDDTAARSFQREGMLIAEDRETGYFIADRRPMRSDNVFNRYEMLSADQSEYYLYRSRRAAEMALSLIRHESRAAR